MTCLTIFLTAMMRLTILVDLDDVLWDLCGHWVNELNRLFGTEVNVNDITDWNIKQFFSNLNEAELYIPINTPFFWDEVEAIDGAQYYLKRLLNDGHRVKIVTATHYNSLQGKMRRFEELFPFFSWRDVVIAYDKGMIQGDLLIDDGIHNLEGTTCRRILFERPHNRLYDAEANGMIRVKTWSEIYEIIERLSKGEGHECNQERRA